MLFRRSRGEVEVFLIHPGGPFWRNKDDGSWSIPKGLRAADEDPLAAARREFLEETGMAADGTFFDLGTFKQPSGKRVRAFALEGDFDLDRFTCNTFALEWPPGSGRTQEFPEADRAEWFTSEVAARKITKGQAAILRALFTRLGQEEAPPSR